MARTLTGIQSTGVPHLGNLLGAILPAIQLSNQSADEAFLFIANMHTLTANKDPEQIQSYTNAVAAAWLACGLDADKNTFYRQSHVPEVTEFCWYLNCFTPYPMLANAHSFKDKSAHLADVNAGLFTYPVLMAADILLYDAELIPVGKDQQQHIEITRDIAKSFNHRYGEILTLPEARINQDLPTIRGTDGRKMSKSYHNTINIFLPEKALKKEIMSIQTDSTPLEEPKDPDTCNVFALFSLLASDEQVATMRNNYLRGNYGYGHAKTALFELVLSKFSEERVQYDHYLDNLPILHQKLALGEEKARQVAQTKLQQIRKVLGYRS